MAEHGGLHLGEGDHDGACDTDRVDCQVTPRKRMDWAEEPVGIVHGVYGQHRTSMAPSSSRLSGLPASRFATLFFPSPPRDQLSILFVRELSIRASISSLHAVFFKPVHPAYAS